MTALSDRASAAIADLVVLDAELRGHLPAEVECEAPAWRLRNAVAEHNLGPVGSAVEGILQLRHDIDDHQLAVTMLRGIRPDLAPLQIDGWISELLDQAAAVRDAELSGSRGDYLWAIDKYEHQLRTFTGGRA